MTLFLITFLALYGGMHLYAFLKLRHIFQPQNGLTNLLIFWLFLMTVVPLLVRVAEQSGMEKTAQLIAWPGYLWMGFLFLYTSALLFSDAVRFTYKIVLRFFPHQLPGFISSQKSCKIILMLAVIASSYAFIEAGHIQSDHVVIISSKLPPSAPRVRIVQVSDVHIGLLVQEDRLQKIAEKIRAAQPDIIVSTGDLVDGKLNRDDALSDRNPLAILLASIPAPSGKFAVVGNHEVYAGLPGSLAFTHAAGFTMLRNQSLLLKCGITISGVDDRAVKLKPLVESDLLASLSHDSFQLLLKHRPEVPQESGGLIDLQLSGHVHGGQIFPFNLLVRLKHPIPCGTTTTQAGSRIHVSRGTGTWGPPMRLFAPPEITIIDIIPQLKTQ